MRSTPIDTNALLRWIDECNSYTPHSFISFCVQDAVVGAVHKDRLDLLRQHPQTFRVLPDRVSLHEQLDNPPARTDAVDQVLKQWHAEGVFSGWRDEQYAVSTAFDTAPCMFVERSAAPMFGIRQYGVHINGFTRVDGHLHLWTARRSCHKPEYPGRLDHLVAGGLAAGLSAYETALKECREEANVPPDLSRRVCPVGLVSYHRAVRRNSSQVVLFVYDLELPPTFVPQNVDGEVAEFYLWPIEKVLDIVSTTQEFKTNCNLVIIDFFVRHGYLCPEDPHYIDIIQGLKGLAPPG